MAFTTVGDIYEVDFKVSKKVGNVWLADPQSRGAMAKHWVVATSDQNAVATVQTYMGHDGTTTRVECHGAVHKILSGVIIAV
jgi:hypothetical protein